MRCVCGRKSMSMSRASTSFTRRMPWRTNGKTSYSKWQLVGCSTSMINYLKSTKWQTMSLNLLSSFTVRSRECRKVSWHQVVPQLKSRMMTLGPSWQESLKMDKALARGMMLWKITTNPLISRSFYPIFRLSRPRVDNSTGIRLRIASFRQLQRVWDHPEIREESSSTLNQGIQGPYLMRSLIEWACIGRVRSRQRISSLISSLT